MSMNIDVGILWDPREPPPPEYQSSNAPPQQHVISHPPTPQRPQVNNNPLPPATRSVLRPLSVSLVAKVVHDTANVSVTQLFWNKTGSTIGKGTYTFPLPAGCTVVDFSCRVGSNRIVRGRVKPKVEARETFNDAARQNQTASLLEQDTPEIFTTTLANIPVNTKLKAEISFITLLKHKFLDSSATTTLTIPTCIASRYNTPPELQHTQTISGSQNISIQVEVLAAEDIKSVVSKTHDVNVQKGIGGSNSQSWNEFVARRTAEDPRVALVTLADRIAFLERDFVLEITTLPQNGLEAPHACIETHPSYKHHKAVMLTIPPKFMLKNESPVHDAEILFVADRSGSMDDKMESLKSAMSFFLKGIPQAQRFNVWCFGTNYTYLWPRSKIYSDSTLREALSYVSQNFKPDMGGTELLPALKAIVDARGGFQMTDVILLTDGQVWRLDETIDFIQQTRRTTGGRVRFFALGIGDAVSHELVEGIAKAGGGYAEVVPAASQGGWEDRLVAVLHAALTGHIGPLRIEFDRGNDQESGVELSVGGSGVARLTRPGILQSPADISALSPFLQNRVFILFDSVTSLPFFDAVNIKATTPSGYEVLTRVPLKALHKKATTLHQLSARALLGDLERGQSWIHLGSRTSRRNTSEEQLARQEGEKLGSKWSLVSKWTSFYAIEEPYEALESAQDPFLDADEPQVHHIAASDLNLLRPRGHSNQRGSNLLAAVRPGQGPPLDEQTGEDDESASASDSTDTDTEDIYHNRSDEESDDDGTEGNGSGRGLPGQPENPNASRNERRQQERDRGNRNPGPEHGSNQGSAQERMQRRLPGLEYLSTYGGPNSTLHTSRSGVSSLGSGKANTASRTSTRHLTSPTLSAPQRPHVSPISSTTSSLLSSPFPIHPLPPPLPPPLSSTLSSPPSIPYSIRQSSQPCSKSSDKYTSVLTNSYTKPAVEDSKGVPYPPPYLSALPPKPILPGSLPPPSTRSQETKRSLSSMFRKGSKSKLELEADRSAPVSSPQRKSRFGSILELSSDTSVPRTQSSGVSKTMGISELPSDGLRFFGAQEKGRDISELPAEPVHATQGHIPESIDGKAELSTSSTLGRNSCEKDRRVEFIRGPVFVMNAPVHNPPASTAILPTGTNTPKSTKVLEKESLVRRLVALQSFDGSFVFTEGHLESLFGKEFRTATQEIELNLHQISVNQAEKYKVAVAIAVIVELEEKYQSCKDLWLLIVEKAQRFVDIWLGGFEKENVFEFAKDLLKSESPEQVLDPTRDRETRRPETTTAAAANPKESQLVPSMPQSLSETLETSTVASSQGSRLKKQAVTSVKPSTSSNTPARQSWLGQKIQRKFHSMSEKTKSQQSAHEAENVQTQISLEEVGGVLGENPKRPVRRRRRPWLGHENKNLVPAKTQLGMGERGQTSEEGKGAALLEL